MSAIIHRDILSIIDCNLANFGAEIETLKKIKSHDEYTYLHSLNVARLSVNLGKRLGFSSEMLTDLGWAALLHDIGKLHVPIAILNKAKKFSAEELAIMQSHPVEALSAFARHQPVTLEGLQRLSAAFEHHQRFDLKGYPSVQRKLHLHPFSRIVAITDTFDAMTTDRIYQRRVLPDVALKLMSQGFGTIFDPTVLQAFITAMGAFPVGTVVHLSDDRLGVVSSYDEHSIIDRPTLKIVKPNVGESVNLMDPNNRELRILHSEFPEDHDIDVQAILTQTR
jgi:HD-GYP domain-containing protein (c-di-GMP phosphodiesterase class II)